MIDICVENNAASDCFLHIDCDAISRNLDTLRHKTRARVMAVVKGNGYGLSLVEYSRLLTDFGIEDLAAGTMEEALALREGGIRCNILLLTPQVSCAAAKELLASDVMLTVGSIHQAETLRHAARETGIRPKIHIKIDTGLGRYGFLPGDLQNVGAAVREMDVLGVYTHFASPYIDTRKTRRQYDAFLQAAEQLKCNGVKAETLHCCASGGLLNYPDMHLDMVRAGTAILGRVPGARAHGLAPAVFLSAPVVAIKQPPERRIGYRGALGVPAGKRIGIVGVGCSIEMPAARRFAGLIRARQYATVNGSRVQVLGPMGIGAVAVNLSGARCSEGDLAKLDVNPLYCTGMLKRVFDYGRESLTVNCPPEYQTAVACREKPADRGRAAISCQEAKRLIRT